MRLLIALALVLLSIAADAQEWVTVRKPTDPGQASLPSILVDSTSIVVLKNGIRRATTKIDFLADGRQHDLSGPAFLAYMTVVKSYDCGKRMLHEDSTEFHNSDGSTHTIDSSSNPKWYPAPEVKAADPTLDFVCEWKPK
ncbi:MAG TPA: hypothetical protein VGI93_16180 [Steroidobacteraceae bacterium]|jgi:hypothetical protein